MNRQEPQTLDELQDYVYEIAEAYNSYADQNNSDIRVLNGRTHELFAKINDLDSDTALFVQDLFRRLQKATDRIKELEAEIMEATGFKNVRTFYKYVVHATA